MPKDYKQLDWYGKVTAHLGMIRAILLAERTLQEKEMLDAERPDDTEPLAGGERSSSPPEGSPSVEDALDPDNAPRRTMARPKTAK